MIDKNEFMEGFVEHVLQYYKSLDCKYFVLKIEDLLNSMKKLDYFEFDKLLKQYNDYRKEQGKSENKYFVLNRDDYQFKNAEQFYEVMESLFNSANINEIMDTVMMHCSVSVESLQEYVHKILLENDERS